MFNSKALLAGTLAALAAFASANPTNPAPDATNFWAVYPGWDMADGAGISTSTVNGTELACLAACNAGTTLSPSCWLKDELDFSAIQTRGFPITLVILGACGTTRALLTHASLPIRSFNVRKATPDEPLFSLRKFRCFKPPGFVSKTLQYGPAPDIRDSKKSVVSHVHQGHHEFASTGHACVNIPSDFAPRVFSMRTFSRPFSLSRVFSPSEFGLLRSIQRGQCNE
ncbi:hypothetical protein B0H16DRAFT_1449711 [Mycena metata]|uniref:Uncharacterized protein n=1 Tax=Mycena metata TaxID=1033252 RepID=A0AAD7NV44_9AGAR|nr:hypothetical protein B0H16DRAFT_1449711 [Mycena metata]